MKEDDWKIVAMATLQRRERAALRCFLNSEAAWEKAAFDVRRRSLLEYAEKIGAKAEFSQ